MYYLIIGKSTQLDDDTICNDMLVSQRVAMMMSQQYQGGMLLREILQSC